LRRGELTERVIETTLLIYRHQNSFRRVLPKKVEAIGENIYVAFFCACNIVMYAKIVLVMRKPDVEKSYSRPQLVGQIQLLGLSQPEQSVDAAGIMCPGNAQSKH